jgi:acyl-CoA thioester hydrolase
MIYDKIKIELDFTIKPYNIDAAGHVNNAVYINWLEDLRTKLFEAFLPNSSRSNFHLVVASTSIVYKKPLHLYEEPVGKMKIDKYERGVLYLSSFITLRDKIVTRAFQKCVFIDKRTGKMLRGNVLRNFVQY